MFILFTILGLAAFVCIFLGLIKPSLFNRFSKKPMTRKRALGIFSLAFVGSIILSIVFAPPVTPNNGQVVVNVPIETNKTVDNDGIAESDVIEETTVTNNVPLSELPTSVLTQPAVDNKAIGDSVQVESVTYVTDEGTPEREIEKNVIALLKEKTNMGGQRVRNIDVFPSDTSGQTHGVLIEFAADSNLTNGLTRRGIWTDTIEIVKKLSADPSIDSVTTNAYIVLVDQYGNVAPGKVMTVNLTKTTWSKINWSNFIKTNLPNVADLYWIHPAIAN